MSKTVYIVLYTLSLGGAERHATSIANYLCQCGYKVEIVLLQNNCIDYVLENGVTVTALSDLEYEETIGNYRICLMDKVCLKLWRKLARKKFSYLDKKLYIEKMYAKKLEHFFQKRDNIGQSVVISFMTIPNIAAAMLKKKFMYKLILGEFTSPQLEFSEDAPENELKRTYFPAADGFVFQTEEQKAFYTYLPNVKKKVIPNPIEEIGTMPFHGKRKKEIVNFCKHVKAKNLPLLIDAFSRLAQEYPDYHLVIYGDGPERANTEACIKKYGRTDSIWLRPYSKNVLELVRESAMFVSSSDQEGISNSMLEAMAIGLPTICTDCPSGGARMFIDPYVNGIIIPMRDPEAMYNAMKYVIDNPSAAEFLSQNAVMIRSKLERNKILSQWIDFLNDVQGERYERNHD